MYTPYALSVPPEALVTNAQENPVPLPPDPVKVWLAPGATIAVAGEIVSAGPTSMYAGTTVFPRESVTRTAS